MRARAHATASGLLVKGLAEADAVAFVALPGGDPRADVAARPLTGEVRVEGGRFEIELPRIRTLTRCRVWYDRLRLVAVRGSREVAALELRLPEI